MRELRDAALRAGDGSQMRHHLRPWWQFLRGIAWAADNWKGRPRIAAPGPIQPQLLPGSNRARDIPFIAALHGATLGGGLETAACAHMRVADETTFFGLPEGNRGIYIGGGGSVRVARLLGFARMQDTITRDAIFRACAEG
jgi:hypothetical protein